MSDAPDLSRYAGHTPGPWRWEFNAINKSLHLVGGRPMHELTVIDFVRWGTSGATMRLRDTRHDGMQLLHRVHERPDWVATESGREHHKHWHQVLTHPDALLSQDAPTLLAEVVRLREALLPFAALLQSCHANMKDDRPVFGIGDATITAGQMRAAVAALAGGK